MTPKLRTMVALVQSIDGLYILTDDRRPGAIVPLTVQGGRIYSMVRDAELDPGRFIDGAKFTGPVFRFPGPERPVERVKAGSVNVDEP